MLEGDAGLARDVAVEDGAGDSSARRASRRRRGSRVPHPFHRGRASGPGRRKVAARMRLDVLVDLRELAPVGFEAALGGGARRPAARRRGSTGSRPSRSAGRRPRPSRRHRAPRRSVPARSRTMPRTRWAVASFGDARSARRASRSAASSSPSEASASASAAMVGGESGSSSRLRGERRLRLGELLAAVQREAERGERQRPVPVRSDRRACRASVARTHVAGRHQRDAEQVVVLRDVGTHAGQGVERAGRRHGQPGAERDLRERAQHFFRVRRQRARATAATPSRPARHRRRTAVAPAAAAPRPTGSDRRPLCRGASPPRGARAQRRRGLVRQRRSIAAARGAALHARRRPRLRAVLPACSAEPRTAADSSTIASSSESSAPLPPLIFEALELVELLLRELGLSELLIRESELIVDIRVFWRHARGDLEVRDAQCPRRRGPGESCRSGSARWRGRAASGAACAAPPAHRHAGRRDRAPSPGCISTRRLRDARQLPRAGRGRIRRAVPASNRSRRAWRWLRRRPASTPGHGAAPLSPRRSLPAARAPVRARRSGPARHHARRAAARRPARPRRRDRCAPAPCRRCTRGTDRRRAVDRRRATPPRAQSVRR